MEGHGVVSPPSANGALEVHPREPRTASPRVRVVVQTKRYRMPQYKRYRDDARVPIARHLGRHSASTRWHGDEWATRRRSQRRCLQRIIETSTEPEGDLVLDCVCGSGTTAVVAEKLGRRWIVADLGRFAIHTTRKRLLGRSPTYVHSSSRTSASTNARSGRRPSSVSQRTPGRAAYRQFILDLYNARPIQGYAWLHGVKQGRMVHVGTVDAPGHRRRRQADRRGVPQDGRHGQGRADDDAASTFSAGTSPSS